MDIFKKISEICSQQLGIDPESLDKNTTFDDIRADSLDVVEIIMAIEDEFDIVIPENAEDEIETLGDLARFLGEEK